MQRRVAGLVDRVDRQTEREQIGDRFDRFWLFCS
jgi:hypothetical protein